MCTGIAIIESELPVELTGRHRLSAVRHVRGANSEFRFFWKDRYPRLPIRHGGNMKIVQWGNRNHRSPLPRTAWTWRQSIEEGKWASFEPEPVLIPCSYGWEGGVWYLIEEGIRGLLVQPPGGQPVVYMVCEPSTRYYQVMTRSERMPVLVSQVI